MFLWLLSWVALLAQFALALLSLAAGLYYLAELIEEYSVISRRIISILLVFVIIIDIGLLMIDGFPLGLTVVGIALHLLYGSLLTTFPVISLCSIGFIGGTVLLVLAHGLAFLHFAEVWHPFQEVLAFFFLCLWLVPFSFFISLSANDFVLPTTTFDEDGLRRRPRRSGFLAVFDLLSSKLDKMLPSKSSKSI
ncbi:hypothetical protein EMCRGX_G029739 [Ephydatia muelleri]|eukprot:Em0013g52a